MAHYSLYRGSVEHLNKPDIYFVSKGDTLWSIAKKYGVQVSDLIVWNDLSTERFLQINQQINIYPKYFVPKKKKKVNLNDNYILPSNNPPKLSIEFFENQKNIAEINKIKIYVSLDNLFSNSISLKPASINLEHLFSCVFLLPRAPI